MDPIVTLLWIAVAFGVWYAVRALRERAGGRHGAGRGPSGRSVARRQLPRDRSPRLRSVGGTPPKVRPSRDAAAHQGVDDPVTALAALALALAGEDSAPLGDVERTLRTRLSGLTDEVHVARAMRTASGIAKGAPNPQALIKGFAPVFERHLTARERADVVAVCEDVVSANGHISEQQDAWLRALRRSLGFEVKG